MNFRIALWLAALAILGAARPVVGKVEPPNRVRVPGISKFAMAAVRFTCLGFQPRFTLILKRHSFGGTWFDDASGNNAAGFNQSSFVQPKPFHVL